MPDDSPALAALLQLAYSGERAAALAYRGHAASLADAEERRRVQEIEREELHHRQLVGEMLAALGSGPSAARERRAVVIGTIISLSCRILPWFVPMYGAGRLERGNVGEYETAARLARAAGRADWVDCLLTMAEVEWEHERYFREKVESHPWSRWIRPWPPLPPKAAIRA